MITQAPPPYRVCPPGIASGKALLLGRLAAGWRLGADSGALRRAADGLESASDAGTRGRDPESGAHSSVAI